MSFEFVKTGKSKGDGILTTNDNNFKVQYEKNQVTKKGDEHTMSAQRLEVVARPKPQFRGQNQLMRKNRSKRNLLQSPNLW